MAKTIYDGQYATSDYETQKSKIVLKCLDKNDIYCINSIRETGVKSADDCGIIAGIGDGKQIKYLVQIDLDKKENRAKVNFKSLNQTLSAPDLNQIIFLDGLKTKTICSVGMTYTFGQKIKNKLKSGYAEYYSEELKKNENKVLNIANRNKGQHR